MTHCTSVNFVTSITVMITYVYIHTCIDAHTYIHSDMKNICKDIPPL